MEARHREVTERLFEIAEERGWWSADWRAGRWRDEAWLAEMVGMLAAPGDGVSVRVEAAPGSGSLWVGVDPISGEMRYFAVSTRDAGGGAWCIGTAEQAAVVRAQEPGQWLTWYSAMHQLRREKYAPVKEPIGVGQWLGGRTGAGSLIAQAAKVVDGKVLQVVWGGRVVDVPANASWFVWRTEARAMAAEELGRGENGGIYYPHYLAMRTAVLHVARRLIKAGKAANDPDNPLKVSWKRGRKKGSVAKPRTRKPQA